MVCFHGLKDQPSPSQHPRVYRWYKNIASYESDFSSLPGDPTKPYTVYGPEEKEVTIHQEEAPKQASTEEDQEEDDLFGSDDEEEDAEAVKIREENLAAYKKKKEGKTKPAAKSIVTLDVKPWGESTESWHLRSLIGWNHHG